MAEGLPIYWRKLIWLPIDNFTMKKLPCFKLRVVSTMQVHNIYMFVKPAANQMGLVLFLFTARVGCATMLYTLVIAIDN